MGEDSLRTLRFVNQILLSVKRIDVKISEDWIIHYLIGRRDMKSERIESLNGAKWVDLDA